MLVSLTFSLVIYKVLIQEIDRFEHNQRLRIERRLHTNNFFIPDDTFPSEPSLNRDLELLEETRHRIIIVLIGVNMSILVISGALGYFLAGRTLKPILQMVEDQNRFIGDASHEFRTPLTSLKTSFEVFLRNKKSTFKKARSIINDSVGEINKLQKITDSLLQLAQFKNLNNNFKFEKVNIDNVIETAIAKLKPISNLRQIEINYLRKNLMIIASKDKLIDLMVILLDNAIKYSKPKSKVDINISKTQDSIVFSVKDYGIGISTKDLPHIFNRFYRADSARIKTDNNGYGLGLSIAKKIVTLHNGSITVKSQLKTGTTVLVKLPISK